MNYSNVSVKELSELLETQGPALVDRRVDVRGLRAVPSGEDIGQLTMSCPELAELERMPLNEWAHGQLASYLGIPKQYYDRMNLGGFEELLAHNVNEWLAEKKDEIKLIKTENGTIRAILSAKYKTIDNINVLRCTLEKLLGYTALEPKFVKCQLGPTKMFLKIALSGINGEVRPGDKYHFGMMITNSEVGAASLKVEPYTLRLVCRNGMVRQTVLRKIHIGLSSDAQVSAATRLLQDAALYSELQDAIDEVLLPDNFHRWIDDLQRTTEVQINEPLMAVMNLATEYKISEENKKLITDFFFKEQDTTQYGLIQGLTRAAQEIGDVEESVRFETIAGELSEMKEADFNKVIKVTA